MFRPQLVNDCAWKTQSLPVVSENPILGGFAPEGESGQHHMRCSPSCTCLQCSSATGSNRVGSWKSRTSFFVTNSTSPSGVDRVVCGCVGATGRCWYGCVGFGQACSGRPGSFNSDTILRWHRAGFRTCWRWKSGARPGRPPVSRELRELIHRMSKENPLWGAPRTAEARVRNRRVDGLQVYDPAPRAAVADLADIPVQPRGCHCGNRSLRGSDLDI